MAAGRSYEQIDEMTVFDLALIFDYWSENPTSDVILKAVYKIESKKPVNNDDPSGIGGIIPAFPSGRVTAR